MSKSTRKFLKELSGLHISCSDIIMSIIARGTDIVKSYKVGEVVSTILRGTNFEIDSDEFVVILGPSGSGKSTLLNILGGIERADSGTLTFKGEVIDWTKKSSLTDYRRKHIGFVFQFYNLLPGLNVLENVQLAAELGTEPLDAVELLSAVGLGDKLYSYPSALSGGQQQRVAIARALCKNPDILLCDEPTGALDSKTSIQVLKVLWNFSRNYHKPIVMVTHNADIAKMADRVFYFKDGIIDRNVKNDHPLDPEELS